MVGRGLDTLVEDVEAVREQDGCARLEIRLDLLREDLGLHLVGNEQGDELRAAHRVLDGRDLEPGCLGLGPRRAPRAEPDCDLDAGVAQVEGVGVALGAVADHGDLAGEQAQVAVAEDGCHSFRPFSVCSGS